jgi:hypothetical protein
MAAKYTRYHLDRVVDKLRQYEYTVRFEKGNFHTGTCVLEDRKIIVVNKYHDLQARIESLRQILANLS